MTPSELRRTQVGLRLVLVGCVIVGLTEWSLFVVGRIGAEPIPVSFWLCALATVALMGATFDGGAGRIAVASFVGPLIAAFWTAPRGDNDGLWVFIIPVIAFFAGVGYLLVVGVRRVVPVARMQETTSRVVTSHRWIASAVLVVCGVASFQLLLARRADPYPALERVTARYPAPDAFEAGAVHRGGDPLCGGGCAASVEATFTTSERPRAACKTAEASLGKWRQTDVRSIEPINDPTFGYREVCSWEIGHDGIDGYLAVSDEPGGTVVRLIVFDPRGR